jgi:hypothetical protein
MPVAAIPASRPLGALRAHVFASAPKISKTFVIAARLEPLKFC